MKKNEQTLETLETFGAFVFNPPENAFYSHFLKSFGKQKYSG